MEEQGIKRIVFNCTFPNAVKDILRSILCKGSAPHPSSAKGIKYILVKDFIEVKKETVRHQIIKLQPSSSRPSPKNIQINQQIMQAQSAEEILEIIAQDSEEFDAVNIATAFHRLAKTLPLHKRLLTDQEEIVFSLTKLAVKKIKDFKPQAIANTAWAFAALGIKNEELMSALANEAVKKINDFKPQEISNTAWAFVVSKYFNRSFFNIFVKVLNEPSKADKLNFSVEGLSQLYQIELAIKYECPELNLILPNIIRAAIKKVLKDKKELGKLPSAFHGDVFDHLKGLGGDYQIEHFVEGYSIDIADPMRKIAIECDGDEYHYLTPTGELTGKDQLRDRLLKYMGWKVIHIKRSEWEKATDKLAFLRQKLKYAIAAPI